VVGVYLKIDDEEIGTVLIKGFNKCANFPKCTEIYYWDPSVGRDVSDLIEGISPENFKILCEYALKKSKIFSVREAVRHCKAKTGPFAARP
jgi:hypothetical protein